MSVTVTSGTAVAELARSTTSVNPPESSISAIYAVSITGRTEYGWIQPPVIKQALELSNSTLIDGIYVQTLPEQPAIADDYPPDLEAGLDWMATDPDVQRDLAMIQAEFEITEGDGLFEDQ